jgi:hypothetical protein
LSAEPYLLPDNFTILAALACFSLTRSRLQLCLNRSDFRGSNLQNLRLSLKPILLRISALGRPDVVRALTNTKHYGLIHGTTSFVSEVRLIAD